jgi:iron complex transport system substrate-binding protein
MRESGFVSAINIAAWTCALAMSLGLTQQAAWAASPARVASLNLCTDELLLALAAPGQISSLTHLSHDRRESAYWRMAQPYPANGGNILSVAKDRPSLIVTMGGGGRDSAGLASAIGARFLDLPFPARLADVERGITTLADALGRHAKGAQLIAAIRRVVATAPPRQRPAIFVGSAGRSLSRNGAGAQWLAAAGYRQIPLAGDRIDREQLLRLPPLTLVVSDYRTDQYSRSNAVPVRRERDHRITTDGRRWTCMGPSLLPEILRLRRGVAP